MKRILDGSQKLVVAVLAKPNGGTALGVPTLPKVQWVTGQTVEELKGKISLDRVNAVVYTGEVSDDTMVGLWGHLKSHVKWVHSYSTGVDKQPAFLKELAAEPNVTLTCGRSAFSSSLGEYVLTAALHFNKQVHRWQRNRVEKKWDKFPMAVLQGKTMGMVGYGDIGKDAAKKAKAFGMHVLALRSREPDSPRGDGIADEMLGPSRKKELFQKSDFVVSTLPGTPANANFCGAPEFEAMKPTGVFISLGRGMVVDEAALNDVLSKGSIAGAALDVFKTEPLPESNPLWDRDNILITAHNADYTDDYIDLGWQVWAENFHRYINEEELVTVVNKKTGY